MRRICALSGGTLAAMICFCLPASARGADYTWVGGDGFWDMPLLPFPDDWDQPGAPGIDDNAFFNTNVSVYLSDAGASVRNLTMSNGALLDLNGNDIIVVDDIYMLGAGTTLDVPQNSLLKTGQLAIGPGSTVKLKGGALDVPQSALYIGPGGSFGGDGVVHLTGVSYSDKLQNDGLIIASYAVPDDIAGGSAGTLEITGVDSGFNYFDLDGTDNSGQVFIGRNDRLHINLPLNDPFSGIMTLSAGANFRSERAWALDGNLLPNTQGVIMGTAGDAATIEGGLLTQTGGEMTLSPIGSLIFDCPFDMAGGKIDNRGSITFANTTSIGGSFLTGDSSRLTIDGATSFLFTANWDWDGGVGANVVIDVNDAGTLNANLVFALDDVWNGEMNVGGGTLNVRGNLDNWGNEGVINVGEMLHTSTIMGNRLIQTAGTFHVLPFTVADMDAPSTWTGGTLQVDGRLRINQSVSLNGGTISGSGTLEFRQNARSDAPTSITMTNGEAIFVAGSFTTLAADLTVANKLTTVQVGAKFAGGGALINETTLRLDDGIVASDLAVVVDNHGMLQLGASAGQVQAGAFEQSSAGVWRLDMGGVGANDYDRLSLMSVAVLDGRLELSLIDGYTPALDQSLNILFAPSGVIGTFAEIVQPATMPAGLMFDVVYDATLVQLRVVNGSLFSADFDEDGDVDADDLTLWNAGFAASGAATHMQGDADGDLDVDGADFLAWQQQLGSTAMADVARAVPEPTGLTIAFAAACSPAVAARRCIRRDSGGERLRPARFSSQMA
jgi:hypothetical protein